MHHCTLNLRRNRGIKSFYDIEEYITNVRMSYDLAIKFWIFSWGRDIFHQKEIYDLYYG